jgi:hypothetical protein
VAVSRGRAVGVLVAQLVLVVAASLAVVFRDTLMSRFDLVSGNVGDNRLHMVTLEHWLLCCVVTVRMRSPIFFCPSARARVHRLHRPATAALRAGARSWAGPLPRLPGGRRAHEGHRVLRHVRRAAPDARLGTAIALLGGTLFTIGNAYYLAVGHAQLLAVAYVPVVALLASEWQRRRTDTHRTTARLALAGAAILSALLFLTSYYIAWFMIFLAGLTALAALAGGTRPSSPRLLLADVGLALVAFGVTMLPSVSCTCRSFGTWAAAIR